MAPDFDQSGVFREFARIGMGPSIGWLFMPVFANLTITAGGTYALAKGTTYVSVNVAAPVTITLPPSMAGMAYHDQHGCRRYDHGLGVDADHRQLWRPRFLNAGRRRAANMDPS
jgi:hypothetical protein